MNLLAVSINHRTAPVELREEVFFNKEESNLLIDSLMNTIFSEGLVLSTCNRTEIYGIPINPDLTHRQIQKSINEIKPARDLTPDNFQNFTSREAVKQLFKVASGIDSLLVGDNQIFKQVKDSFQLSNEKQFSGFMTKRLFDCTIQTGKRALTETQISDGAVTVSYAAVQLIEKIFSNLNKKSALVVGAGETGELAAKHLIDKSIGKLSVSNRTQERAEQLASKLNADVISFRDYKQALHNYDIVVSATSSPGILISKDEIENTLKMRSYEPMVLMDIALPRDIDPGTKKIEYVFYHDIDSLNIIVEQNLKRRRDEIPKVERIVEEELTNFYEWYNSLQAAPTIKRLRDLFEEIRRGEVEKNINRFSSEDKEKLEIVTKKIINKILHYPTVELKKNNDKVSGIGKYGRIGIIREMFGIDKKNSDEKSGSQ